MSENTPPSAGDDRGAYPPPPAYAAPQPPQYQPQQYGSAPQYPGSGAYGAAPYPYAPQEKTNTLAVVSLIASLVGIVGILPFIGSLVGVITGHMSLNQLKRTSEKGHGMALAGTIIGWVGLGLVILVTIIIIIVIAVAAQNGSTYGA